jgi:hypothetical protein
VRLLLATIRPLDVGRGAPSALGGNRGFSYFKPYALARSNRRIQSPPNL